MQLTSGDRSVVRNVRCQFVRNARIQSATDEQIAQAWRDFSQSEDYGDDSKFPEWVEFYNPDGSEK